MASDAVVIARKAMDFDVTMGRIEDLSRHMDDARMVQEIRFYHLQRQPLEAALPRLMERVLEQGFYAVIRLPDEARLQSLDAALWTYDPASFLPHGTVGADHAARQPIVLTTGEERPNEASIMVLVDGAEPPADLSVFERCLYMFDGNDPDVLAKARADWKKFKNRAESVSYWQQKPQGGWEQKA